MAFSEFNSQFTSKKRRHEEAFPAELTNKPRPKRRPRRRRRPRYWRRPQFFPVKLSFASRPPPGRSWARAGRHDAPPQNTLPEAKRRRFSTEIKAEFSDQKVRVIAGPDDLTVVEVREIFRILDAGLRAGFGGDVYTADVMNAFLRVVFDSGCWSPDDPTNRPQMPDVRLPFTEVTFSPAVQCISSQVPEEDPCQSGFRCSPSRLLTVSSWCAARFHGPAPDDNRSCADTTLLLVLCLPRTRRRQRFHTHHAPDRNHRLGVYTSARGCPNALCDARNYIEERAKGNTTLPVRETVQFCSIDENAWGLPLHLAMPDEPWVFGVRVERRFY
ncbi:uncharacterized protein F5Z01DRAFT_662923 [Emericellopsis atlantica]|uniref:Uncharacterized protein n=1 Tax=Emericellopsis atlantica TaxID=2614577 RepID=A0A9P8CLV1_9HYPO|nr:uncharacterized protein F5Z01DRAFT_662923 [Emericellopsis atlantica]KAG9251788.1 hypothetical protein F5Z01DRAFT_662923 [Emericellopsis atlantica]